MDKPWNHHAKLKTADTKDHKSFDFIYMTCPEIGKSMETESTVVVARPGRKGGNKQWLFNEYGVSSWVMKMF